MRRSLRTRLAATFSLIALGSTALMTVGATPAAAGPSATCSYHWTDKDSSISRVINPVPGYTGIALKDGPQPYCNILTRVPWGVYVSLDCFIGGQQNVNGVTTWSHVRFNDGYGSPTYSGWISDYHLSDRGSNYRC